MFSAPDLGNKHILLVEDNDINQEVALRMLDSTRARVELAQNGAEALEIASRSVPDLILMDLQMPVMDGYEATRKLRSDGYAGPIVALSAAVMDDDRKRAAEAGVDDHIGKPIESNVLYAVLSRHLEAEHVAQNASDQGRKNAPLPQEVAGFDIQRGLHLVGGDQALYLRMLKQLHQGISAKYRSLVYLLNDKKLAEAQHIAHTLKGAAGTLGATQLHQLATEIDSLLKGGDEVHEDLIHQMAAAFDVAEEALSSLEQYISEPTPGNPASVEELRLKLEDSELVDEDLLGESLAYLKTQGCDIDSLESFIESMEFDSALAELNSMLKKV